MGIHWHSGTRVMKANNIGRAALLVGIGLVSGIALTLFSMDESGWWQGEQELDMPLFDTDINEVRSFTYLTSSMTLTAQRSKASSPFAIQVTYTDNRPPEHCLSSSDLNGVLSSFAHSKVKKQIHIKEMESKYPTTLGYVDVKDVVIGEPIAPWRLFESNDHTAIAVEKLFTTVETDITPATIMKLEAGCKELGNH